MISIVTPVYNEEDNIVFFYDAVTQVMKNTSYDYELLFVNDGSRDKTEMLINQLAQKDSHVRALTFARNFGHQIAITCGMDMACGDAVITMDGDMQHPPELIPVLLEKWREGFDIVQTVRTATEDAGFIKRMTSSGYYAFINSISKTPIVPGGSDFRLMDKKAIQVFRRFREHSRFIRGIVGGMGFKQTTIEFEAPKRHAGISKFSMKKIRYGWRNHQFYYSPSSGFLYRHPCRTGWRAPDPSCHLLLYYWIRRSRLVHHDHPDFPFWKYQPYGAGYSGGIRRENPGRNQKPPSLLAVQRYSHG